MINTDLHVKILLLKCLSPFLKILVLENQCKIKAPKFYTDLGLQKQC